MKTATITQYHVYGTKNTEVVDVTYRGKLLKRIYNYDLPGTACSIGHLVKAGIAWSKEKGFSHVKVIYN